MKKISKELQNKLYLNLQEDNDLVKIIEVDKNNQIVDELNNIYLNGEEFDLHPFKHLRIISFNENTDYNEYVLMFNIPISLKNKNDKFLFKNLDIESFIRKNRYS